MQRLDRHGWAEGFTLRSYGCDIGIRVDRPGMLDRVRELLPPGWERSRATKVRRLYSLVIGGEGGRTGARRPHIVHMNARRLMRSRVLDRVLEVLESDLQLYVAERARRRVFVHAGVVAWNGSAIVIPGPTHSGKTTLVAELLRAGATYYSDEYAVLDAKGRVHPYPRPLSLRRHASDPKPERVKAAALGAPIGDGPLPVRLIALTAFRDGARWRPRRLTPGQATLALLENTVPARRRPKTSLTALHAAVQDAEVVKGARGDARAMAEKLLERVG
jgi:hypothetical protein